jgi:lysophospholipase L1-like esterase
VKKIFSLVLLFLSVPLHAEERVLRILPLGDSITRGSYLAHSTDGPRKDQPMGLPNPRAGGYRKPLQDKLRAAGIRFDFVGELNYNAFGHDGVVDLNFDPDHQGLAGFSNAKILSGGVVPTPPDVLAKLGVESITASGIVAVLEKFQPDVILLMSGANGFDAVARDLLITSIGAHSQAHLLVGTITAQKEPRKGWENVDDYNRSLPATVAARRKAGQAITLVDLHAVVAADDLLPDGVHPNQAGLDKIAEAWFQAIKTLRR